MSAANGKAEKLLNRLATTARYIRWLADPHTRAEDWATVARPVTVRDIQRHLDGEVVLGAYGYCDDSGTARTGVLDIDLHVDNPTPEQIAAVEGYAVRKLRELHDRGVVALLVRGHDRGSFHIVFDTAPIAADRLGRWLAAFAADAGAAGVSVDTFPSTSGRGNAVRLPGRHHKYTDQWSASWSGTGWEPWPAALDRLFSLTPNAAGLFPDPGTKKADRPAAAPGTATRPGDLFNAKNTAEAVLMARGWHSPREENGRLFLTRPGKESGNSAAIQGGTAWVYTRSVPGLPSSDETGKPYTAFALVAHLDHGGDFARAARELARAGYSAPSADPKPVLRGGAEPPERRPAKEPPPPYRPFPVDALPAVMRDYVACVASAMNTDPSYSALHALALAGAAIGSTHLATPKKGWREPPFIFAATIGTSGSVKSPPFRDVEDIAEDVNDRLEAEHKVELVKYQAALQEWQGKKVNGDEDAGPKPEKPVERAFSKSDATVQALAQELQNNPRGLLVACDELAGWISGFVRYASRIGSSDLPQWLQLSNAGVVNILRKTGDRPKIRVRGVGVSVCGTIQPGVIAKAMTEEMRAAGLFARLLVAYPPRRPRVWSEAEVDEQVRARFVAMVNALFGLEAGTWEATGKPRPHLVKLTPEAKAAFVRFYNANGRAMETAGEDEAASRSKMEGYALRFALIRHCCAHREDARNHPIAAADMAAAVALAEWFVYESARVYALLAESAEDREVRELHALVVRLATRCGANGCISVRDLQRSSGKKYATAEAAKAALLKLVAAGLGDWAGDGDPPTLFRPEPTSDSPTPPTVWDDDEGEDDDPDNGGESDTPSDTPRPTGGGTFRAGDVNNDPVITSGNPPATAPLSASDLSDCRTSASTLTPRSDASDDAASEEGSEGQVVGRGAFTVVTTAAGLSDVVTAIEDGGGVVGLDTETTGLDPRRDRCRLIQLATARGTFVIDVFRLPDPRTALDEVFEVLARAGVVGHNVTFDLGFLDRLGFAPRSVADTMLASQVLHAGGRTVRHGLRDVAARVLNVAVDKAEQKGDWSRPALTPEQLAYAARDAETTLRLWDELRARAAAEKLDRTLAVEMAAVPAVAWASSKGVGFDRAAWEALAAEAERKQNDLREQLDAAAPARNLTGSRNWNANAEVVAALASVGITVEGTDDDTLAGIDHPLAALVREYRGLAKLVGTYGRKWLKNVAADGRVYAAWKQLGAEATGRMSCKEPNLQQLPRDNRYRKCFVAPPGRVLVKADYSQIELRIAAKLTGDKRMLAAYRDNLDVHTMTARALLGREEVSKADRQLAKAVNFGLLYGQGARGLKAYALGSYGVALTEAEAAAHRETFFKTYAGLRAWHRRVRDGVQAKFDADPSATHEVRTLGGRRRVTRVAKKKADGTLYPNVTEALNTPVQGTGADGLKAALALLWERRELCPDAFPVLIVHDEVVVECDADKADAAVAWVTAAMVDGMAPLIAPVAVEVEATVGRTWGG